MQAGKTALHWAAQFGEARLLHELMRTADDVNPRDEAGNTPLHLAALNAHLCGRHVSLDPKPYNKPGALTSTLVLANPHFRPS